MEMLMAIWMTCPCHARSSEHTYINKINGGQLSTQDMNSLSYIPHAGNKIHFDQTNLNWDFTPEMKEFIMYDLFLLLPTTPLQIEG